LPLGAPFIGMNVQLLISSDSKFTFMSLQPGWIGAPRATASDPGTLRGLQGLVGLARRTATRSSRPAS
jgi:hypothetical protein